MKNSIYKKNKIWYFDDYFHYVTSIKHLIPKNAVEFISDPQFYLFDKSSLYDSKITTFKLTYNKKCKNTILTIKLIGAYGNIYLFKFYDVIKIILPKNDESFDHELLIHQFHIIDDDIYQYDFLLSNNSHIKITFKNLAITKT